MSSKQPAIVCRGMYNKSSWKAIMDDVKSHNTEAAYISYKQDLEDKKKSASNFRGIKLKELISSIVIDNIRNLKGATKSMSDIVKELADHRIMMDTVNCVEQEVLNYDSDSTNKNKINPDGINIRMHAELIYTKFLIEILLRQEIKDIENSYNSDDLVKIFAFSGDSSLTKKSKEIQEKASKLLYECYETNDQTENIKKKSKLKKETRNVMKELAGVIRAKSKSKQNVNVAYADCNDNLEER